MRASDPRLRLQRPVPGEGLHLLSAASERALARADWKEPELAVPERQRAVRTGGVRTNRRQVDPQPNAPQLIRLVQHPYALETTRARPDPSKKRPQRIQIHEGVRAPFGAARRDALQAGHRLPFPTPTDVHPIVARPARPSLSEWLADRSEK